MKPGSSSKQQQPKHIHKDKETQTCNVQIREETVQQEKYKYTIRAAAWERSPWELGLVFCQWVWKASFMTPVQQTFGFPPRPIAKQQSHIHFFIVLQFPLCFLFPPLLLAEFVMLFSGRSFHRDVAEAVVTRRFPRSPALPPGLLLAHRSGQEDSAIRPVWVCANLGRVSAGSPLSYMGITWKTMCSCLLWSSSTLHLNYVGVHE